MKTHKFDVAEAEKHGIEKAILLEHLRFHQQANEGNENLEINGRTYAFIKPSTIKKMYPYLSYPSVRRWLKELENDGIIESCKPHKSQGNHLKYYYVIPNDQNDQSNDQNDQSKNDQNDQSSIVTNVKYHYGDRRKYESSFDIDYQSFTEAFNELYGKQLRITEKKRKMIRARLQTFTGKEIKKAWETRKKSKFLNSDGSKYMGDWAAAMRNDEKIDHYLNLPESEKISAKPPMQFA